MLPWLERRLERYAIPNMTGLIIAGQVIVFAGLHANPNVMENIVFSREGVLRGEAWRLVSHLFIPPSMSVLWAFFAWYVFYLMGNALEQTWGTFRYNVYLLTGWLATTAAGFIVPGGASYNGFLGGSVFLAFAALYPNFQLSIFFLLPIRVYWLALITWLFFGWRFVFGVNEERIAIAASVANFLLFFHRDILARIRGGRRSMSSGFDRIRRESANKTISHVCHICGVTSDTNPDADFRYCSKCEGEYCYCEDHIRNHEHIDNDSGH